MSLCYAILNTMLVICLLIFLLKNDYKHFSHEANIKKTKFFWKRMLCIVSIRRCNRSSYDILIITPHFNVHNKEHHLSNICSPLILSMY